jgi:ATP-dependent protease ClpP protease subunit
MTRSQVCKHQVCDYCGERFGMVTQRWWGNKFCKTTCKTAYLCENGAARLAAALAVAVLMLLLLASANAAPSEQQPPAGVSLEFIKEDGTAYIDLSGPIMASTADDVRAALGKYRTSLNRVVLFLDSVGGRIDDGDRLIEALNEIKLRYRLITVVSHGKLCASMCIPIFLQGEDRLAARASIWLFHEAAQRQANGELRNDTAETWRLFRKYYAPAGVPTRWLKSLAPMIEEADLWQTGGDLISAKSGIILHPLGDRTVRDLTTPPVPAEPARDLPLGKKTAADEVANAPIRSE